MDLDKEEEDLEMDVDDEEEEEQLPISPPPLSPLRTPPPVSESSFDSDIPVTTTAHVGRHFKGPLSTYEIGPRLLKLTKRLLELDDQELNWRGFKENCPTKSIDVLATYGDADPPKLQEPSDTQ
nr:hypothetical protein [Tanacetum cinerariifolium]